MKNLIRNTKSFLAAESGATAMIFGVIFSTVMAAVGFAVDYERAQNDKKIVQRHLDATILHLGRGDYKTRPQGPGTKYLLASLKQSRISTDGLEPVFTYDPVEGSVSGSIVITPQTIISGGIIPQITMTVRAKANPKVTGTVEIALVLDNSGSMNFGIDSSDATYVSAPNRRADALQEAVTEMFDVIYSNPLVTPAVSVVPYATSVDITDMFVANDTGLFAGLSGTTLGSMGLSNLDAALVKYQDHSDGKAVWTSERFLGRQSGGGYRISLDAPNSGSNTIPVLADGRKERWCDRSYYWTYGSQCIDVVQNSRGVWYLGTSLYKPFNGLLPMTRNAQTVRDYVAAFEPEGGTAGHIGAAWGLYTLVPEWDQFFDHEAGKPQQFGDTSEKYLVIMTDGEFNSAHDPSMEENDVFSYFASVCEAAREKNVTVFTVGLKVIEGTKTDESLKACAGDSGRYFSVDNRHGLKGAFKDIGREAGVLRISS